MPTPAKSQANKPRLLAFAVADLFGVLCVVLGGSWFILGKGGLFGGFPNSPAEAVAAIAGGIAVMIWAVAKLLREIGAR
jgi:hypothetical protein